MQIRCIGQFTIDDIILPDGSTRMNTMGGNGMYSAAGALLWAEKGEVAPVSRIGCDYPAAFLCLLESCGVDMSHVKHVESEQLRSWFLYEESRERRCLCRNKELLQYPPISEESFHLYFEAYKKLHLNNSPLLSDDADDTIAHAYHLAPQSYERHIANLKLIRQKSKNALISLDPSPFYMRRGNNEQLSEILSYVNIVLPSREEVFSCFGEIAAEKAARLLTEMGPDIAVIKMGAKGAYIYVKETEKGFMVPSVDRQVTDTTGAGDSFCGGFLYGYCKTGNVDYAACCGAVSASYALADYGPGVLLNAKRDEALPIMQALLDGVRASY